MKPIVLWIYGYPNSGKTTLAEHLEAGVDVSTDEIYQEIRPSGSDRTTGFGWDFLASRPESLGMTVDFLHNKITAVDRPLIIVDGYVSKRIFDSVVRKLKPTHLVWVAERK
jgi:tRNA uridine 5-carbamoylmethylation protein Kti12